MQVSGQRFRALATATGAVFYRMNADWSEMQPLDGKTLVASNGAPIRNWLQQNTPESEHAAILERVARCIADNSAFELEHRVYRPDRSVGWTRSRAVSVVDDEGAVVEWVGIAEDVTDAVKAREAVLAREELLRLSQERLRFAIEAGELGTFYCPMPLGPIVWNAKCKEHFWLPPDAEVDFDRFYSMLHRDDRARTRQAIEQAVFRRESYDIEYRTVSPIGQTRWVRAKGRAYYDGEDNPTRFDGITLDISEQKRNEAKLTDNERRSRQIADAMPQIVWAATPDGVLDYYNRRWFDYIGVREGSPATEVEWSQFVHPEDLPSVAVAWSAALSSGDPYHEEFRARGADGNYRWFLVRAEPIRDASGRVTRWYGTCTDIEGRKRDEARNRFLLALDDAVRPLTDPEEITAIHARLLGEHLRVDRCAYADVEGDEDTFNLTGNFNAPGVPSIIGRYTFTAFGDECLQRMRADEPYVVVDADVHEPPIGDLSPYRATLIQAVICVPLRKQGRFVAAMAVHQRVPRRWVEDEVRLVRHVAARCWESIERARVSRERQQLLESEQAARVAAEGASRMKDEFLATLSHELRTPLNAILGWSQIIAGDDQLPEDVAEGIEIIGRNARAQAQIIEDLLDMSRIISGRVRLDVQRVDLSDVVRAAVQTVRPAADAKGVRLQSVIDPLRGIVVSGDANRLQQVLWNLMTNAVKFTPRGGRVQVVLERVDSHVEIVVTDTGEGIKAEFLPHVFDRFRQADASTTRRHGGLGLGLSIVRQLVELHGGTVRATSRGPGEGSVFTVSLPLSIVQTNQHPMGESRHPQVAAVRMVMPELGGDLAGVRVLVVDDEPDARSLIKRLLEDRGAACSMAASAEEATRLVADGRFDVLVSDIGMPGEDGYTLIRRVRALAKDRGGAIPAIALTAYARPEDRVRAVAAGFLMHVAKPVEPVELATMVAAAAGRTGTGPAQ